MESKSVLLMKIGEEFAKQVVLPEGQLFHFGVKGIGQVLTNESKIIPLDQSTVLLQEQFDILNKNPDLLNEIRALEPLIRRWVDVQQPFGETAVSLLLKIQHYASILESLAVDKIIFGTGIAHHLDAVCWSLAAQSSGIKQIFLYPTIFDGVLLPIIQLDFHNRDIYRRVEIGGIDGATCVNRFIDSELEPSQTFVSSFQPMANFGIFSIFRLATSKSLRKIISLIRVNNLERDGFQFHKTKNIIESMIAHRRYLKAYKSSSKANLPSDSCSKIAFFGHVDPEATTFPGGLPWLSQIEFLVALRKRYPNNEIYFLEHPGSWSYFDRQGNESKFGLFRTVSFLDKLKALKIIPLTNSSKLSKSGGCYVAATLVGTIALQESLSGRKSIVGGGAWFHGLPGTIAFHGWRDVPEAQESMCNCRVDQQTASDAFEFLARLIDQYGIPNAQGIGGAMTSAPDTDGYVSSLEKLAGEGG